MHRSSNDCVLLTKIQLVTRVVIINISMPSNFVTKYDKYPLQIFPHYSPNLITERGTSFSQSGYHEIAPFQRQDGWVTSSPSAINSARCSRRLRSEACAAARPASPGCASCPPAEDSAQPSLSPASRGSWASMRGRNSTSASSEIRGLASVRRRSQISGSNIHSGIANCRPFGNLTITIGPSPPRRRYRIRSTSTP